MNSNFIDILVRAFKSVNYSAEKDNAKMKSAVQDLAGAFPKEKKFMMRNADDHFLCVCKKITASPDQFDSLRKSASEYIQKEYLIDAEQADEMTTAVITAFASYEGIKLENPKSPSTNIKQPKLEQEGKPETEEPKKGGSKKEERPPIKEEKVEPARQIWPVQFDDETNRIDQPDQLKREESSGRRKKLLIILGAAIAILAGTAAAFALGLFPGGEVTVPDFTGMTFDQAKELAEEKGLQISEDESVHSDEIIEDRIAEQDPMPDEPVSKGSTVYVSLSLGPLDDTEYATVPDVVGLSEDTAYERITDAGFECETEWEDSDEAYGEVISQSLEGEQEVGATVTIWVSNAELAATEDDDDDEPQMVKMPDLIDMELEEACWILDDLGFDYDWDYEETDEYYDYGYVSSQWPEAGEMVEFGSEAMVYIPEEED